MYLTIKCISCMLKILLKHLGTKNYNKNSQLNLRKIVLFFLLYNISYLYYICAHNLLTYINLNFFFLFDGGVIRGGRVIMFAPDDK